MVASPQAQHVGSLVQHLRAHDDKVGRHNGTTEIGRMRRCSQMGHLRGGEGCAVRRWGGPCGCGRGDGAARPRCGDDGEAMCGAAMGQDQKQGGQADGWWGGDGEMRLRVRRRRLDSSNGGAGVWGPRDLMFPTRGDGATHTKIRSIFL